MPLSSAEIKFKHKYLPYGLSLLVVAAAFSVGWFAHGNAILQPTDLIMFYLLVVVFVSLKWGRGPAITASLSSVLAYDFFYIPPKFSFLAFNKHDVITLAGFLIVGLTISNLTERLRKSLYKTQQMEVEREKEKLYATLLSSISHDLRTPLASITATLENLIYHGMVIGGRDREQLIETAFSESMRLNRLVENLLDMTKVEGGALDLSLNLCDVGDLVGVALHQFSKKQIGNRSIRVSIPDGFPEILLDFNLMVKVLVNLIDNAFKYSPPETPIAVEAKKKGLFFYINIIDQGRGIPEKDLKKVFAKFYRVDQSPKIPGSGLGLSICKGIIDAHKGEIYAENIPGKGLKITVKIPVNLRG